MQNIKHVLINEKHMHTQNIPDGKESQ